jgi:hypothetical protein
LHLPLEYPAASPSRPTAVRQLLPWTLAPYSTSGIGGPLPAGVTGPLRSAFRVWLPSWRLPPFDPVPVLFHTGSAHGIHPSERSPLARYPTRFRPEGPTYRFSCRCSLRRSTGPARQAAVSGLRPCRESLAITACLALRPLDAPLGFPLLGFARRSLDRDSARSPLTRFADSAAEATPTGAPESRSAPAWPRPFAAASRTGLDRATLLGFLHLLAPAHSGTHPPWLWIHLALRLASLLAANALRMGRCTLPELCRFG